MKKLLAVITAAACLSFAFTGCKKQSKITLTMWHVYGEQADSPMNDYVQEFNSTIGKDKGIIVNVTLMSNASQIGEKLLNAQQGKAGVPSMPDLFFCHASNAEELGEENLVNWRDKFTKQELDGFVQGFLSDGTVNGALSVLPISKSTHLLFLAGNAFNRFAEKSGVTYDDLATWDGFFATAEKYYEYSHGKPFCALDYLIRAVELDAISRGATDFYGENGWYKDDATLLGVYEKFANSIANGHIVVSDLYSNTQVMTGETVAGISSSAAVLYYNDKITYPDNTSEYTNLQVLPVPCSASGTKYATQAGVGLCAYKTTDRKTAAATVFAKWFTEEKRNLDFVAQTGYMPVKNGAFDKLSAYTFKTESFRNTYSALKTTVRTRTMLSEPNIIGYYEKTHALYFAIRDLQRSLKEKYENGATTNDVTRELIEIFRNIPNKNL